MGLISLSNALRNQVHLRYQDQVYSIHWSANSEMILEVFRSARNRIKQNGCLRVSRCWKSSRLISKLKKTVENKQNSHIKCL